MSSSAYLLVFALSRGGHPESMHYGAVAVVAVGGELFTGYGDSQVEPFLRSSAKPFQALPLVEAGGLEVYGFSQAELALICASHSGTDEQAALAAAMQTKIGVSEDDLLCGLHPPYHRPTARRIRDEGLALTANRHNCSGKHSGMLAFAKLNGWPLEDYVNSDHPVQRAILSAFAELCDLAVEEIAIGVDGCSAPNFAVPLRNAALAYARLMDPSALPKPRGAALNSIRKAMLAEPEMVAGPGRLDTRLMQGSEGRVLAKAGAEGYQALGLAVGALKTGSPAMGISIKIADGDARGWARESVTLEVLRQLGALSEDELKELSGFGTKRNIKNQRGLVVGEAAPVFELESA